MSAVAQQRTSGSPDNYYAPDFLLEIEGQRLDPKSKGDVIEVKVTIDLDELASVDLKLNNYDDTTFDLKWSDSKLFRLGNRVHVKLGYVGSLVSMLRGPITTLAPEFVSDGAPTLAVRAMDRLVVLRDSRPPEAEVTYKKKKDWEIAQAVARRHQLRFEHDDDGPVQDLVVQRNTDDLTFLMERAARIDFKVYMKTDPKTGKDVLRFGKPTDGREGGPARTYVLAWGNLRNNTGIAPSLVEFKPTISSADQVQSVTVRGWDTRRKKAVSVTAKPASTPGVSGKGDATGPAAATRVGTTDGRKDVVVNAPVQTEEEARRLAQALLAERAYAFLTATGKAIGLPDLRPGDNVEVHGVGERFSGTYFVTRTVHTLNAGGLLTEFTARKTYEGTKP
jgi:Bacteriophage probable baseplate hub protein